MITINKPYIEHYNNRSRCVCDIWVDSEKRTVWFEVDRQYAQYLCTERADAYVIGLLNWAMRHNHNIVCKIPVTEELLYQINTILIPSLTRYVETLHCIKVEADTASALKCGTAVGTGLSCGIDSFSAIYNHIKGEYPSLDITHLCVNNVGAFNECYSEYGEEKVRLERYAACENVASELGIELIATNSNFAEEFKQVHILSHTYSSIFAIYMMQKLWRVYYYASSGDDYSSFSITEDTGSARYELLSLQCFSISGLRIYSEGGEKLRIDKTRDIIDWKIVQENLHVCINKPYNCNVCSKCRRTLVSLDYLEALDSFKNVFDIDYYRKHRREYYKWIAGMHRNKDIMNEPVFQGMLERKEFNEIYIKDSMLNSLRFIKRFLHKIIGKCL